jgi:oxidase EvaA
MAEATLLAPVVLQPADNCATGRRFARSAMADGTFMSTSECLGWLAERRAAYGFHVERIPFADLDGWTFSPPGGNLVHRSGRFYSIEGLHVRGHPGTAPEWTQPIIVQPEIGILGILVKEFDGVLYCLMQAKMEPGNSNVVQLSPTVQATRSNYLRVHQGRPTPYLEYFLAPPPGRVLADSLQSEQGGWFLRKRNRNIVVEVTDDVEVLDDYCWLTVGQIQQMLSIDDVVNMDARTVLSCVPFAPSAAGGGGGGVAAEPGDGHDGYGDAVRRSMDPDAGGLHTMTEVHSWLTANKAGCELVQQRIPFNDLAGWRRTDDEIAHVSGEFFRIVAVAVRAASREVSSWSQPLLAPVAPALLALLTRRVAGVLHLLVQARAAAGALDIIEIAPTVHCMPHSWRAVDPVDRPRYLDHIRDADPLGWRYNAWLSEEGGRFLHARNRYLVLEVDDEIPLEQPTNYCWLTVHQLMQLVRAGNCVNVEARTLLAGLHTWISR